MSDNSTQPLLSAAQRASFIRDGCVVVSGLIAPDVVASTREALLNVLRVDENDPATWRSESVALEGASLTHACRTPAIEAVVEELMGPHFLRGVAYSPYLEQCGQEPMRRGFIPVLAYPKPGPRFFAPPDGYHIDGMHLVTTWPTKHALILFAYLNDTAEYGGATTVLPGSHRQVFEHWTATKDSGNTVPPPLSYAAPQPVAGKAGDVIFMHYLMVHSGSTNFSERIRVGLNSAVLPDPQHPYQPRRGAPQPDWTPLDCTLRTDNLPVT